MSGYLKIQDSVVLSTLHYLYPASSWFVLRQTREKPLRATICSSFEFTAIQCHGRAMFKQADCAAIKVHCKNLGYVERHMKLTSNDHMGCDELVHAR